MMNRYLAVALIIAGLRISAAAKPLLVNKSGIAHAHTFDGIGGLSGGGATTRLLVDYPPKQRSEILDLLFKPNYGASLQILKVEIGGDSQSTDGTESSHMHDNTTVDLHTGYEWWLMAEAKKRNPEIKLYGLPWAYPGWVGTDPATGIPSGSPFAFPNQTSRYIMEWVKGARSEYDLEIDYVGIWNERASDAAYAQSLRNTLNAAGFSHTKIVAKDGGADICDAMMNDAAYAKTVDIIGLHYPSDYANYSVCHKLDKPIWASEESSSYDDLNGAACWGRVINSHFAINGMTSSIMWNLVGAYYHGTNWYASSMLTSDQPWSGHYEVNPVVWATAHVTQFTKVGWKYLPVGSGSGELPHGGFYTTIADPNGVDFSINIVKISREHAPCTRPGLPDFNVKTEHVKFELAANMKAPATLAVWYSNYNIDAAPGVPTLFKKMPDVKVVDGKFSLHVPVGAHFTVSTIRTATKNVPAAIPASQPSFPLPHTDDFQAKPISQEAPLLADQIGAFEVHYETGTSGNKVMKQMVPQLPIGWSDSGTNGPMTLIGMREWQDITISVDFKLPLSALSSNASAAGCVATRVDQMWRNGIIFCVAATGNWSLTVGGPRLGKDASLGQLIVGGELAKPPGLGVWISIELTTIDSTASASVNGVSVIKGQAVRNIDTGFAAIGANDWFGIEYDHLSIKKAGADWNPTSPCAAAKVGDALHARNCSSNGVKVNDLEWELDANWFLKHVPSGLCATASSKEDGATLSLQKCVLGNDLQKFTNDYTRIRNTEGYFTLHNTSGAILVGRTNGSVAIFNAEPEHRCTNTSVYNLTVGFNGTQCNGLEYLKHGHRSPQACAEAACQVNADVWQWLSPKHKKDKKAAGCWAGSHSWCNKNPAWVGASRKVPTLAKKTWSKWVFFPNTGQLRNQYVANTKLGYPMCLTTC